MGDSAPVAASVLAGALLMAAGGLGPYLVSRAAAGLLPRNAWAGLRTPGTLASDTAWRAGHAAARRWVLASGIVLALGGLAALLVGAMGGPGGTLAVVVALGAVPGAVLLAVGAARADAAGRSTTATERR